MEPTVVGMLWRFGVWVLFALGLLLLHAPITRWLKAGLPRRLGLMLAYEDFGFLMYCVLVAGVGGWLLLPLVFGLEVVPNAGRGGPAILFMVPCFLLCYLPKGIGKWRERRGK